jgi:hypothetical protein
MFLLELNRQWESLGYRVRAETIDLGDYLPSLISTNLASGNFSMLNACLQQSFKDGILNTLKVVSGNHHGSSDIHQENNSAVDSLQPFISGNNRPFLRNRRRRSYTNLQ